MSCSATASFATQSSSASSPALTRASESIQTRVDQLAQQAIQGTIYLKGEYVYLRDKMLSERPRWGSDNREAFVGIVAFTPYSEQKCTQEHGKCRNFGWQGSLQECPPDGLTHFPSELPLRFFYKPDGQVKKMGDTVNFIYEKVPFTLTIQNRSGKSSFHEELAESIRVTISLPYNDGYIRYNHPKEAQQAAQNNQSEWIHSD